MRSAVDEILRFNRSFPREQIQTKLDKLVASPFSFLRGTFHLFASDMRSGPFAGKPLEPTSGPIVGDLHTENFGAFRAITNEIVYDVNDFDETTEAPYEYDLRRLLASLILGALSNKLRLGDGVVAAEIAARSYLQTLVRVGHFRTHAQFERMPEAKQVRNLLSQAKEVSRADFLKKLVAARTPGSFAFQWRGNYRPVRDNIREEALKNLPEFLKTCLAPPHADTRKYVFQDIAFRFAGTGSLGRARYALLLGKGKKKGETLESLRLIEWKESLDSGLDAPLPHAGKDRARNVFAASRVFQLFPKRYIGQASMFGRPMQAREIGANDVRFNPQDFEDSARFHTASRVFGEITARVHLLGSLHAAGPRDLVHDISGREDRFIGRLLAFAVAYAEQTVEDHAELLRRRDEVARDWSLEQRAGRK